ncbi:uncharacterized protein LOC111384957 [Olea europaea var. sylvestris]|uniref:uncharacterized protein LOC111384957 n=1 Tax=Olea europaea var. sylvestris TaxID=158386 RepID=UPI000C1D5863|nr:uncharacterized protein LOC111384957 [Olea europaea var. sylvestris]
MVVDSRVAEPTTGVVLIDALKTEQEGLKLKDLKIWDSMKKKNQGNARAKRMQLQALRGEFETLQMKEGESVSDYFSRTMAIANKMRIHGDTLEDVTIVGNIFCSMTTKFNYVVCSIEESNDIDDLSHDELQSALLVY